MKAVADYIHSKVVCHSEMITINEPISGIRASSLASTRTVATTRVLGGPGPWAMSCKTR